MEEQSDPRATQPPLEQPTEEKELKGAHSHQSCRLKERLHDRPSAHRFIHCNETHLIRETKNLLESMELRILLTPQNSPLGTPLPSPPK